MCIKYQAEQLLESWDSYEGEGEELVRKTLGSRIKSECEHSGRIDTGELREVVLENCRLRSPRRTEA